MSSSTSSMIEPKDSSEQYRGKTVRKSSRSVSQVGNQVVSGASAAEKSFFASS